MQIDVHDDARQVCIWLTRAESQDPAVRESLKPVIAKYYGQKYLVGVYESGTEDLFENTLALLKYNRKKTAEREVKARRDAEAR